MAELEAQTRARIAAQKRESTLAVAAARQAVQNAKVSFCDKLYLN